MRAHEELLRPLLEPRDEAVSQDFASAQNASRSGDSPPIQASGSGRRSGERAQFLPARLEESDGDPIARERDLAEDGKELRQGDPLGNSGWKLSVVGDLQGLKQWVAQASAWCSPLLGRRHRPKSGEHENIARAFIPQLGPQASEVVNPRLGSGEASASGAGEDQDPGSAGKSGFESDTEIPHEAAGPGEGIPEGQCIANHLHSLGVRDPRESDAEAVEAERSLPLHRPLHRGANASRSVLEPNADRVPPQRLAAAKLNPLVVGQESPGPGPANIDSQEELHTPISQVRGPRCPE